MRPQGRPLEELGKALLGLIPEGTQDTYELRRSRIVAMLRRSSQGLVEAAHELGIPEAGRLLIIVDQFEEIFRFEGATGSDADDATAFVRLLMEAIGAENPKIRVMLTMRLDFLGDCARFQRLPEAISDGQFLVPNLSRAERHAAIEEPAAKCGKRIKPEVVQLLLNDIGEDPDQLPVLQHVLMRMWQQAGDGVEIDMTNYVAIGGIKNAISVHADQIYQALKTDAHRLAAKSLFKTISERDIRGRFIRRPTTLDKVTAIVSNDDKGAAAAGAAKTLEEVIEAYRAPDCCFLLPPADEKLVEGTLINITHESLLRSWVKLVGTPEKDGWIAQEDHNGQIYRGLLEAAENDFTLPSNVARQRQQWWRRARPNKAWADRYGNNFQVVEHFVQTSGIKAFAKRAAIVVLAAVTAISATGFALYRSYEAVDRANYEKVVDDYRTSLAKVMNLQKELDQRNQELTQTIRQAQNVLPQKDQETLNKLLQASPEGPDAKAQRPPVDPKTNSPPALASNIGFMWIGSAQAGNLYAPDGTSVLPDAVKANAQYLTSTDIYLRQGLPDRDTYAQKATIGIMPENTRVEIVAIAPPFSRPSGDQYWAEVRVVKLALPFVYFQFAGGTREQAQQISKALQDEGYKIPGEERTAAAAGKHETRYFFPGQRTIAQKLASDTGQVMQQLGYSQQPPIATVTGMSTTKNNPDGRLELWLEIPAK